MFIPAWLIIMFIMSVWLSSCSDETQGFLIKAIFFPVWFPIWVIYELGVFKFVSMMLGKMFKLIIKVPVLIGTIIGLALFPILFWTKSYRADLRRNIDILKW